MGEKTWGLYELIEMLEKESEEDTRYPVRVIFTNSFKQYKNLVKHLVSRADQSIALSDLEFCNGSETLTDLDRLTRRLKVLQNQIVVIPAIGEYLRAAMKVEKLSAKFHSLFTLEGHCRLRIWLPIFSAKEYFDELVGKPDLRQNNYIYYLDETEDIEPFVVNVFSINLKSIALLIEKNSTIVEGIKNWLSEWDFQRIKTGQTLITKNINLFKPTKGIYVLNIITTPLEILYKYIKDGARLEEKDGTLEHWSKLCCFLEPDMVKVEELILKALNVITFDPFIILCRWEQLVENNGFKQWLFWLWYRLEANPESDYISFAVSKTENFKEIPNQIELAIFLIITNKFSKKKEWLTQRQNALKILKNTLSNKFWERFNALDDNRLKLQLLSNNTFDERVKIIEIISGMLKTGKSIDDINMLIKDKYKQLYDYLNPWYDFEITELKNYFAYYRKLKLENVQDSFDPLIEQLRLKCDLHAFDTRGKILNQIQLSTDAFYLWIDGMGLEWVSMFITKIKELDNQIDCEVKIGQVNTPTITEANKAWEKMGLTYKKIDKLDSISHVKDKRDIRSYFDIVAMQFDVIEEIAKEVVELFSTIDKNTLVVTADHGLSRLAAIAFHACNSTIPPRGAEVKNLGRYCLLPNDVHVDYINTYKDKDGNLLFMSHNHFTSQGHAPGEIHGGMTPEEFLVPIIILTKEEEIKNLLVKDVGFSVQNPILTLNKYNQAVIRITVEEPVNVFVGMIDNQKGNCRQLSECLWEIVFEGLIPKKYDLRVFPNNSYNNIITEITIKRRGLEEEDLF